jgi:epimerase EvaD
MLARELAVAGAFEFSPEVFADDRGHFVSPYQEAVFVGAVGRPLFPVAQSSISMSKRHVVRGLHFTTTPPGCAKYVYCTRGRVLDIVVDIRVGSPTYGVWDTIVLDPVSAKACYFPLGVGHGFVALEDGSVMSYLLSQSYVAANELAVSIVDPAVALPIPPDIHPIMSARDLAAPTLAEAHTLGLLPDYDTCMKIEENSSVYLKEPLAHANELRGTLD